MHLLIVDDEHDIVELIAQESQSLGYQVDVAYHGDHAIELCLQNPQKYDLILTDLNMPRRNGVEFIQWLRSNAHETCAIVVMTASIAAHPDLNLKMIDHLVLKPFSMNDLMEIIGHFKTRLDQTQKN